MTPEKLTVAQQLYESRQHTVATIAKTVGVSRASIYRHLHRARSAGPSRQ
jgi:DNA-binding transcriptional regulator LsrR (DeoR family)